MRLRPPTWYCWRRALSRLGIIGPSPEIRSFPGEHVLRYVMLDRNRADISQRQRTGRAVHYYRFVSVKIIPSRLMSTRLRKLMPSKAMGRLLPSTMTAATSFTATSPTLTVSSLRR
jgi:hypothetical protein